MGVERDERGGVGCTESVRAGDDGLELAVHDRSAVGVQGADGT